MPRGVEARLARLEKLCGTTEILLYPCVYGTDEEEASKRATDAFVEDGGCLESVAFQVAGMYFGNASKADWNYRLLTL